MRMSNGEKIKKGQVKSETIVTFARFVAPAVKGENSRLDEVALLHAPNVNV